MLLRGRRFGVDGLFVLSDSRKLLIGIPRSRKIVSTLADEGLGAGMALKPPRDAISAFGVSIDDK